MVLQRGVASVTRLRGGAVGIGALQKGEGGEESENVKVTLPLKVCSLAQLVCVMALLRSVEKLPPKRGERKRLGTVAQSDAP